MSSNNDSGRNGDFTEADKAVMGLYRQSQTPVEWDASDEAILAFARNIDRPGQAEASGAPEPQPEPDDPSVVPFRRPQPQSPWRALRSPVAGFAVAASLFIGIFAGQALTPYFSLGVGPDYAALKDDNARLLREVARYSDWKSPEDYMQVLQENRRLQSEIEVVKQLTNDPAAEDIGQPLQQPLDLTTIGDMIGGYACSSLSLRLAGPGGAVVEGFVSTDADLQRLSRELAALDQPITSRAAVAPPPFCGFLEVLNSEAELGGGLGNAPLVAPQGGGAELRAGAPLVLAATATSAYDGYLYVDVIGEDGRVRHLAPDPAAAPTPVPAGGRLELRAAAAEVALAEGRALLLAISSPEPLFAQARPDEEAADAYLAALAESLRRVSAQAQVAPLASGFSFVDVKAEN